MIYAAILKNNTILADYSEDQGDFQLMLTKFFSVNKQNLEFYVLPYSRYEFAFLHFQEFTFSSITYQNSGKFIIIVDCERTLLFLQQCKQSFLDLIKYNKDNLTLKTTTLLKDLLVINQN